MKIIDVAQGSPEWIAARAGKLTASRIADATAKTKNGFGASRANYAAELVAERLTGVPAEKFVSGPMIWGTEHEGAARALYEFMRDVTVAQVGLVLHPAINMAACSPDGLVGDEGLVEIKAPNTATHIETLLGAPIAEKYLKQMQFQMACAGRTWCDFVSFDPRLPTEMQIHVTRVKRDSDMIMALECEAAAFLAEVDATVSGLLAKYQPKSEAA